MIMILLLINSLTFALARLWHGGKLEVVSPENDAGANNRVWLIAGLQNQPETAYQYVSFSGYEKAYLRFSYLGYSPKVASEQLDFLVGKDDLICGISVGAKTIEYADGDYRKVLINPCSHPRVLKPILYAATRYLSPLAKILSYGLGWLSALPIIPADMGQRSSFALLADELFWIGWGDPKDVNMENCSVIISAKDEFLECREMYQAYNGATTVVEINSMHARIGSEEDCAKYQSAIDRLIIPTN